MSIYIYASKTPPIHYSIIEHPLEGSIVKRSVSRFYSGYCHGDLSCINMY